MRLQKMDDQSNKFNDKIKSIAYDISDQLSIFSYLFDETKIVREVIQQLRVRNSGNGGEVCDELTTKLLEHIYDIFCK